MLSQPGKEEDPKCHVSSNMSNGYIIVPVAETKSDRPTRCGRGVDDGGRPMPAGHVLNRRFAVEVHLITDLKVQVARGHGGLRVHGTVDANSSRLLHHRLDTDFAKAMDMLEVLTFFPACDVRGVDLVQTRQDVWYPTIHCVVRAAAADRDQRIPTEYSLRQDLWYVDWYSFLPALRVDLVHGVF